MRSLLRQGKKKDPVHEAEIRAIVSAMDVFYPAIESYSSDEIAEIVIKALDDHRRTAQENKPINPSYCTICGCAFSELGHCMCSSNRPTA